MASTGVTRRVLTVYYWPGNGVQFVTDDDCYLHLSWHWPFVTVVR